MNTVPDRPDPEADARRALKYAARQVTKWRKAETDAYAAIRFAHEAGNSYREIAGETGVPFNTVARIVKRHDDDQADEPGQEAS